MMGEQELAQAIFLQAMKDYDLNRVAVALDGMVDAQKGLESVYEDMRGMAELAFAAAGVFRLLVKSKAQPSSPVLDIS